MNILLLPSSYLPQRSGVQVTVQNLAKVLTEREHRVTIAAPKLDTTDSHFEMIDGIEVHRIPFVFPWRILWEPQESLMKFFLCGAGAIKRLARLMARKRVEIIHVHYIGAQLPYALLAQLITGGRMVLTLHGTEFFRLNPSSDKMRSFLVGYALRRVDQVTAVSSHLSNTAARLFPEVSHKIVKIPSGVAVDEFDGAAPFPFPFPYLLSLGRLNPIKGYDVLLAAFRRVADRDRNVHLIIGGNGPERIRLHAIVLALRLRDRVRFAGEVDRERVKELLAGCEFLVLSSWSEGVPLVALEAMALGKAVVGTRVGGIPEVVSDFETGRLVPPGDPQCLAEAMLFLLQNRDQCKAMGEKGRTSVRTNHDFAQISERYLDVYRTCLARARSGWTRQKLKTDPRSRSGIA